MIFYSYFNHPNSVCMTYFQHCKLSFGFGVQFLLGSFKAFVHAFIPSMCITSTTDLIEDVKSQLVSKCKE